MLAFTDSLLRSGVRRRPQCGHYRAVAACSKPYAAGAGFHGRPRGGTMRAMPADTEFADARPPRDDGKPADGLRRCPNCRMPLDAEGAT